MLSWHRIGSTLGQCRPGQRIPALSRYHARCFVQQIRQESTLPDLALLRALVSHNPDTTSVVHSASGRSFTYGNLVADVILAQDRLLQQSRAQLQGKPVAFLAENSYDYVVMLLSILASDAIALPLSPSFPTGELRYILDNSQAPVMLATGKYAEQAEKVLAGKLEKTPLLEIVEKHTSKTECSPDIKFSNTSLPQGGMMLYTSGTTNRPKGVFLPHSALAAQSKSLVDAWSYTPDDRLLHILPLHHIHGTVNAILAPLLAGSSIEFMYPFNPTAVWNRLAAPFLQQKNNSKGLKTPITFFTAVPTIYHRLMTTHDSLPEATQAAAKTAISPSNLRLNISGSAALPTPTKAAWSRLSGGNVLLERYGMTEVGMALSCGLNFEDRVDGSVGWPLPSVEARLFDLDAQEVIESGKEIDSAGRERVGEIQLRGPTIFKEYWRNEKATSESFINDPDGKGSWFKTGDVAIRKFVDGAGHGPHSWSRGPMYFIQGRQSVDIIKTGGEKVSALEVERELLSLPEVAEAAILGLPSDKWGQKVAAVLVLDPKLANVPSSRTGKPWGILDMRRALKDKLAMHKIPQELRILPDAIPRNAMGKVNKKTLAKQVFGDML